MRLQKALREDIYNAEAEMFYDELCQMYKNRANNRAEYDKEFTDKVKQSLNTDNKTVISLAKRIVEDMPLKIGEQLFIALYQLAKRAGNNISSIESNLRIPFEYIITKGVQFVPSAITNPTFYKGTPKEVLFKLNAFGILEQPQLKAQLFQKEHLNDINERQLTKNGELPGDSRAEIRDVGLDQSKFYNPKESDLEKGYASTIYQIWKYWTTFWGKGRNGADSADDNNQRQKSKTNRETKQQHSYRDRPQETTKRFTKLVKSVTSNKSDANDMLKDVISQLNDELDEWW